MHTFALLHTLLHIKHFCTHFFTNFLEQSCKLTQFCTLLHTCPLNTFAHLHTLDTCAQYCTLSYTSFCTLHIILHTCTLLTRAHNIAHFWNFYTLFRTLTHFCKLLHTCTLNTHSHLAHFFNTFEHNLSVQRCVKMCAKITDVFSLRESIGL